MTSDFDHIDIVHTEPAVQQRRFHHRLTTCRSGFSLLELLAVIMIITILAAVAAPSLMQISNSAARKGAVNVLLNAFEQARVAALTSGTNTYVGFANQINFSDKPEFQYRAFIIFRDPIATDPTGTDTYVPLTKWETLPKNISFKSEPLSVIGNGGGSDESGPINLTDDSIPFLDSGDVIPVIKFSQTGSIISPNPNNRLALSIYIYEGYFAEGQDNFIRQRNFHESAGAFFERIAFSKYTGRAQIDISTLPQ